MAKTRPKSRKKFVEPDWNTKAVLLAIFGIFIVLVGQSLYSGTGSIIYGGGKSTNTGKADLIIDKLEFLRENTTFTNTTFRNTTHTNFSLLVTVKNIGGENASESVIRISGPRISKRFHNTTALPPNATQDYLFDVGRLIGGNVYYTDAKADTYSKVPESRESNNFKQLSYAAPRS